MDRPAQVSAQMHQHLDSIQQALPQMRKVLASKHLTDQVSRLALGSLELLLIRQPS
jgi:hypothetical protein